MFKKIAMTFVAGAALLLAGCAGVNNTAKSAGVDVEFINVYAGVNGFADNAYVTIRLYEATLDAAIYACDETVNPDAAKTPDVVCNSAAAAAARVSPGVETAAHSIGTYLYLDGKVNEILADGKVVPDEILAAASEAFFKARTEWRDIETDVKSFIGQ